MDEKIKNAESRVIALAAFYVLESLLLELSSRKTIKLSNATGLLKDASKALAEGESEDFHKASELVEALRERYEIFPDPDLA